jgi:hypothetical protein
MLCYFLALLFVSCTSTAPYIPAKIGAGHVVCGSAIAETFPDDVVPVPPFPVGGPDGYQVPEALSGEVTDGPSGSYDLRRVTSRGWCHCAPPLHVSISGSTLIVGRAPSIRSSRHHVSGTDGRKPALVALARRRISAWDWVGVSGDG